MVVNKLSRPNLFKILNKFQNYDTEKSSYKELAGIAKDITGVDISNNTIRQILIDADLKLPAKVSNVVGKHNSSKRLDLLVKVIKKICTQIGLEEPEELKILARHQKVEQHHLNE